MSLTPRIIPSQYVPVIGQTCNIIAKLTLGTLYGQNTNRDLNGSKLATILEEGVLDYLPEVMMGSARYDLAIVGQLRKNNSPKLITKLSNINITFIRHRCLC